MIDTQGVVPDEEALSGGGAGRRSSVSLKTGGQNVCKDARDYNGAPPPMYP